MRQNASTDILLGGARGDTLHFVGATPCRTYCPHVGTSTIKNPSTPHPIRTGCVEGEINNRFRLFRPSAAYRQGLGPRCYEYLYMQNGTVLLKRFIRCFAMLTLSIYPCNADERVNTLHIRRHSRVRVKQQSDSESIIYVHENIRNALATTVKLQ